MEESTVLRCLNFDLMIEYVAKNSQNKQYELIGVFPLKQDGISKDHKTVIEVKFDKELDSIVDLSKICYL